MPEVQLSLEWPDGRTTPFYSPSTVILRYVRPGEQLPVHELTDSDGSLTLRVQLPRLQAAADLDVQVGEASLSLCVEGLYRLQLELPKAVLKDAARCKFDKKKRALTVRMPVA